MRLASKFSCKATRAVHVSKVLKKNRGNSELHEKLTLHLSSYILDYARLLSSHKNSHEHTLQLIV